MVGDWRGRLAAFSERRSLPQSADERSYFLMSLALAALTWTMFRLTAPLQPTFLPIVLAQGLVATLFFGWLPLYFPELFPIRVRPPVRESQ